uniref:Alternative protein MYPN n=1 Tax=Homo sapiens TaxID=9606 RepID=L8ECL4_HUMAN|nr:alternative protein MYPN [Homo sapiens]
MANLCYQMPPTRCWSGRPESTLCSLTHSLSATQGPISASLPTKPGRILLVWSSL